MVNIDNEPEIVKTAYNYGITDMGQLTDKEKRQLKKAVKKGVLMTFKVFTFPIPKNYYTANWDDLVESIRNSPDYVYDLENHLKENALDE